MVEMKSLLRRLLYPIYPFLRKGKIFFLIKFWIYFAPMLHMKALRELKGKQVIRCVFFALDNAVWKYDSVYRLMQKNPRFDPIILVCPIVNHGNDFMIRKMEEAFKTYKDKGYAVIKSFDSDNNIFIDVRKDIKPDIIVYTNPYEGLIDDRYYIRNYMDILSFYVHYGYNSVTEWDLLYKQFLTNVVWRYYIETPYHLNYVKDHSLNNAKNCVVTGYPGVEDLYSPYYKVKQDPWKISNKRIKRIIWAPHHSIENNGILMSSFLLYSDFMLNLAHKYDNSIQIAFKPHPFLKNKLYNLWGKEKTNRYYQLWSENENTFFTDGEYVDLFLTSDAMIHDSGSFLIEYLYTQKPVMRMMNGDYIESILNNFAKKCFEVYYKGYNENEIEQFVCNIIEGKDPMKKEREVLFNKYLQTPNGKLPSENIIDDIIKSIDLQKTICN